MYRREREGGGGGGVIVNPLPSLSYCGMIGSGEPLQSPLRPPGTDVKVGTESKGDGELPPGRWWSELTVIHTN